MTTTERTPTLAGYERPCANALKPGPLDAGMGPCPKRGETRELNGVLCRFIERELEGDKWEVLGPARLVEEASPVGGGVRETKPGRCEMEEAVHAWIRDDAPLTVKMAMTPAVRDALVDKALAVMSPRDEEGLSPFSQEAKIPAENADGPEVGR